MIEDDIPKYLKKGKRSRSNSEKRSNHKHDYEWVIKQTFLRTFEWGKRCKTCGRIDALCKSSVLNYRDFLVPNGPCCFRWLTVAEIHEKYPEFPIYKLSENGDYELISI